MYKVTLRNIHTGDRYAVIVRANNAQSARQKIQRINPYAQILYTNVHKGIK
jgi:hypothetical protein